MREPIQHSITELGSFITFTTEWLTEMRESAATVEEVRQRPQPLQIQAALRALILPRQRPEHVLHERVQQLTYLVDLIRSHAAR